MTFAQVLTPPSVGWVAIAPEIVLGVGAALILLYDVQFKPKRSNLGLAAAAVIATAVAFAFVQYDRVQTLSDATADQAASLVAQAFPFDAMIVLDANAVFGRFAMLLVTGLGLAAGWRLFERLAGRAAEGLALMLISAAGFMFMASSTHLMMIFLGLEVGSIALYVLAGITRERIESDEAAIKYFLLGSVASAVFIYGVALTYAGAGSMNLLEIQAVLARTIFTRPAVLLIGIALMIVGLGFKVSAAPFHSWAPDVYQGAPGGIVGYMAAAAKIGGFAALIRILFTAFPDLASSWGPLIAGIAALSMLLGSTVALVQDDIRRMLAYSGVAHAGFILTGVVAGGPGTGEVWFYLGIYTVQLVGAFGVVAAVAGAASSGAEIDAFRGLAKRVPFLAATFSVLLLGMSGLPLTSGFVAKFGVFTQAWQAGYEWLVIVAVLASVIAFFFYLRVIVAMYMQEPVDEAVGQPGLSVRASLALAALITVVVGIVPGPLLSLAGE
ncbi:MAG: NADH-quinone oxidoreductase subunit N, partial [Acidimicrobiia bacterium]|nr:NADH-quinone oxidoreductase subunit N [Acidimicrobiia bacterium]